MHTAEAVEVRLDSWNDVGRNLLACDPMRFEELLKLASLIVRVANDPLSVTLEECGTVD